MGGRHDSRGSQAKGGGAFHAAQDGAADHVCQFADYLAYLGGGDFLRFDAQEVGANLARRGGGHA